MTQTEALTLALEALETPWNAHYVDGCDLALGKRVKAITAIKEALAQPDQDEVDIRSRLYQRIHELETQLARGEQEPVAWRFQSAVGGWAYGKEPPIGSKYAVEPLYTTPPQPKEPEQEPVGQLLEDAFGRGQVMWFNKPKDESMLYTTPSQRTWVGLTEEDIDDAEIHLTSCRNNHESWIEGIQEFAQAIEAKLKEKNY